MLIVNLYAVLVPANSLLNWFTSDDAFYYFKTAQNIAEGRGITFDGLGRNSGFHPLWMAVLVPIFALAQFDLILPLRLVVLLSALLCAGTAVLLYRLAKRSLEPLSAALVGILWAFSPIIHSDVTELGLEAGISAFFIALLVFRVARQEAPETDAAPEAGSRTHLAAYARAVFSAARQTWVTGLLAGLVVLARLDNIFLVLVLGLWLAFRPVRLRYLLVGDLFLIALGVLWSYMARVGFGPQYAQSASSSYWMVIVAMAVRLTVYYFFGLYGDVENGWRGLPRYLARSAGASLLSTALISGLMLALFALRLFPSFPRLVLAYEAGFALAAVVLTRLFAGLVSGRSPVKTPPVRWLPVLGRLLGYFAPLGIILLLYMGASLLYFGTPSPVSGQIKRWWGTLPNPIYGRPVQSLSEMLGDVSRGSPWKLPQSLVSQPGGLPEWTRLLVSGSIALALLLWQRARSGRALHHMAVYPLLAGSMIQFISYTGTGYLHMRSWYWVGQMMVTVLLLGVLVNQAVCFVQQGRFSRHAWVMRWLVVGFCGLVVLTGTVNMVRRMPASVSEENREYYLVSIRELEENTEPGALVGSTGGGVIAYFVRDRTIVNLDGLMNTREYFELLQQGRASEYLDAIGLDYVFASETMVTDSDPYFQFKGRLRKLKDFGGATLLKWQ